jgi:hypothetical protein
MKKQKRHIAQSISFGIFLFAAGLFSSCENAISFEVPQPEGASEQDKIPRHLHGTYVSLEDSSILTISKNNMISYFSSRFTGKLSELDSADRASLREDTTFVAKDGDKMTVRLKGDSLYYKVRIVDTLYSTFRHDVLKRFRGYFFLNHEVSPKNWTVIKLGETKEGLVVGRINAKDDLQRLRELTHQESDTVYNFKPTRKQMKKFIHHHGFHDEERFVRVKKGKKKKAR